MDEKKKYEVFSIISRLDYCIVVRLGNHENGRQPVLVLILTLSARPNVQNSIDNHYSTPSKSTPTPNYWESPARAFAY
jgi:hypothetical protein